MHNSIYAYSPEVYQIQKTKYGNAKQQLLSTTRIMQHSFFFQKTLIKFHRKLSKGTHAGSKHSGNGKQSSNSNAENLKKMLSLQADKVFQKKIRQVADNKLRKRQRLVKHKLSNRCRCLA